jgi:hypothetical protein
VPVWSIAPQSLIVAPAPDEAMPMAAASEIWGWAWADGGVGAVEVAVNGEWQAATLEPAAGQAWQRFALRWAFREPGTVNLSSRAIAKKGGAQPASGCRNSIYSFAIAVT